MNPHVLGRVGGIRRQLLAVYQSTATASSATKGAEREFFIDLFLSQVLPSPYRFGTGDATDASGNRSGQLDVVVEYPLLPSLPLAGGSRYRLYLAEAIAACIEVKSDVAGQWDQVLQTANNLRALQRSLGATSAELPGGGTVHKSGAATVVVGGRFSTSSPLTIIGSTVQAGGREFSPERVPILAVGYKGWSKAETLREHLRGGEVDGILVLEDPGLFVSGPRLGGHCATGDAALWEFICCLHAATKMVERIATNPRDYLK